MNATVFNDAQVELLNMMAQVKSPDTLSELKQAISDFFAQKAEEEVQRLWATGALNEAKVESFRTLHERTPYRN